MPVHLLRRLSVFPALVFAAAVLFALSGCDARGPADLGSDPPPQSFRTDWAVSLIPGRLAPDGSGAALQGSVREAPAAYVCVANALDPDAPGGYSTYRAELSFSEDAKAAAGGQAFVLAYETHLAPGSGPEALGAYRLADSSFVMRAKCRLPYSEEAYRTFVEDIAADLAEQFGPEGYRFARVDEGAFPDFPGAGTNRSRSMPPSAHAGAAAQASATPDEEEEDEITCKPGFTQNADHEVDCNMGTVVVTPGSDGGGTGGGDIGDDWNPGDDPLPPPPDFDDSGGGGGDGDDDGAPEPCDLPVATASSTAMRKRRARQTSTRRPRPTR